MDAMDAADKRRWLVGSLKGLGVGWTVALAGAAVAGVAWAPVALLVAAVTAGLAVAVGAYSGWWLARAGVYLRRARAAEYRYALLRDDYDRLAEQQVRDELAASTRAATPERDAGQEVQR